MKTLITIIAVIMLQTVIYPTIPGTTVRDFSQPAYIVDRTNPNVIHPTIPGTTVRDFNAPSYVVTPDRQPPVYHPPIVPWRFYGR